MDASASGRLAALLCLAAAITAPVVVAQPAPSVEANPTGVELRYQAFAGCPEREAFAKNLDARRRGAARAASAVQLEVRLRGLAADGSNAELANRVEGSIVVRSANGVRSARRIVASTCGEAADALALIAALALQGIEVEEVSADDTDERSTGRRKDSSDNHGGRSADRPRTSDASPTKDPSAAGVVSGTDPSTTTTTEREASAETAAESRIESEVVDESAGKVLESTSEERAEDDPVEPYSERTTRAYVLLSGGVASGVLPRVQPLAELSLGLEKGAAGVLFGSVHAAFRISPNQTRHFDQGVVTFAFWTGLSAVCLGARDTKLSASACATLEVGLLSAGASETEAPRNERRAWVALGPGLTFGYDVTSVLRLQLRAEVLTPLARYRLELPRGTAVHDPPTLGLRAGLGAGFRL